MCFVMKRPIVSVIIPTYNSVQYLGEAIESVFLQTYQNLEVIVVDDGSTDDTASFMNAYRERVKYLRQQNQGPSKARNAGISIAIGPYTAFLDADDVWVPEKLEKQINAIEQDPNIALIYSRCVFFDEQTGQEQEIHPKEISSGNVFETILDRPLCALSSVVVDSRILKAVNGFDEALNTAEDTHLYLKIARDHKVMGIPDILVKKRNHRSNLSSRVDVPIGTLGCLDRIVELFPELDVDKYLPMRKAYLKKGKGMIFDYFASGAYYDCNRTAIKLLGLNFYHPVVLAYFILTLFPAPLIRVMRSIVRSLRRRMGIILEGM